MTLTRKLLWLSLFFFGVVIIQAFDPVWRALIDSECPTRMCTVGQGGPNKLIDAWQYFAHPLYAWPWFLASGLSLIGAILTSTHRHKALLLVILAVACVGWAFVASFSLFYVKDDTHEFRILLDVLFQPTYCEVFEELAGLSAIAAVWSSSHSSRAHVLQPYE